MPRILKDDPAIMQIAQPNSLPVPDDDSAAHSLLVDKHIRGRIADVGTSISFAEFMHEALYAPGLGYYSAGATKFGAAGDFVTAPEVSTLFGKVLARQCASVLAGIEAADVLEIGAGSGKLAADMIRKLGDLDALPRHYSILEVSAELRERQADRLRREVPDYFANIRWLTQLPHDHRGVIVANEVLDALPVERFLRRENDVAQLRVAVEQDRFVFTARSAPDLLANAVFRIEQELGHRLPAGYSSEVCLAAPGWISDLAASLDLGVAFLFDYGVSRREYYAADRSDGWLRCHFRHHAHSDPLILPGIQDLTAWVDFSVIAAAAVDAGLNIEGYVTQAHFLLDGGLADELADFADLQADAQLELSGQVKLLTLPGEMGEKFKCLGISRGSVTRPAGLGGNDRTHSL